ncbi:LysR family transcriptional regulator [Neptuniibacter caesariensis]|uniref:Hypothetical LysR, Transcriptional regulator n=1 Tax=Neptuniibacter caesariensis TaxID=207954 RepID=A0A7U8C8I9_NEPCE|nr:LysR family transcriptional regulator [Neptuniibacter caesariensis]EAR61791.1 hypothetical LysR, Transcriptional regulator [Neptuniibacter caesariensis]
MINPLHLRTFITLIETQHFTNTADVLHMTQPGVSQHIKKLEAHLNCPLIHRFGKKFEVTEAGEKLYRFAIKQFHEEADFLDALNDEQAEKGDIKLSCSGAMAMKLYPSLLRIQKRYPEITVSMEAAPNQAIVRQLKSNQIELGLITQRIDDPELEQVLLGYDRLCLVAPAGRDISWAGLVELGFINHPDGHHYGIQILEANFPDEFRGIGTIKQSGYINQLNQILLPVSEGLGFTVLPESSVTAFACPDKIQVVPLQEEVKEPVYKIQKKYRPLPKRYELLESLFEQSFSNDVRK